MEQYTQSVSRNFMIKKLKQPIFSFFESPISELFQNTGFWYSIVFHLTQEIQTSSFFFSPKFDSIWSFGAIGSGIRLFSYVTNPFVYFLEESKPEVQKYLDLLVLMVLVFVWTMLIRICLKMYSNTVKKDKNIESEKFSFFFKILIFVLCEFLAVPIIYFLTSAFACKYDEDQQQLVNSYSSKRGCFLNFKKDNKLIIIIELMTIFVFIPFCLMIKSMNFSRRIKETAFGLKRSNETGSRAFCVQCVIVLFIHILHENSILLGICLCICNMYNFYQKSSSHSYIDGLAKRVETSITSISLWVCFSFTISIIGLRVFRSSFDMATISFVILLASISLKPIFNKDDLTLLGQPLKKHKSGFTYLRKLETLLMLYEFSKGRMDRNSKIVYYGYLEGNIYCQESSFLKRLRLDRGDKEGVRVNTDHLSKVDSEIFLSYIERRYLLAIRKFRDCISLRISFLYFLMDYTNQKNAITYQLKVLEGELDNSTLLLTGETHFIKITWNDEISIEELRRLVNKMNKKDLEQKTSIIKRSNAKVAKKLQNDVIIMKLLNYLDIQLEKSTRSYLRIWQTLNDQNPKIGKVSKSVKLALRSLQSLELLWHQNEKYYGINLKARKHYGLFLKNVLLKRKEGEDLVKAAIIQTRKNFIKRYNIDTMYYREKIQGVEKPLCVLSMDSNENIIIFNCNMRFTLLLGYRTQELRNLSIDKITEPYTKKFYKSMFDREEGVFRNESILYNKLLMLKTRYGTLKPCWCDMSWNREGQNDCYVIISLKPKVISKLESNILVDEKGRIINHCTPTCSLFKSNHLFLKYSGIKELSDLVDNKNLRKILRYISGSKNLLPSAKVAYNRKDLNAIKKKKLKMSKRKKRLKKLYKFDVGASPISSDEESDIEELLQLNVQFEKSKTRRSIETLDQQSTNYRRTKTKFMEDKLSPMDKKVPRPGSPSQFSSGNRLQVPPSPKAGRLETEESASSCLSLTSISYVNISKGGLKGQLTFLVIRPSDCNHYLINFWEKTDITIDESAKTLHKSFSDFKKADYLTLDPRKDLRVKMNAQDSPYAKIPPKFSITFNGDLKYEINGSQNVSTLLDRHSENLFNIRKKLNSSWKLNANGDLVKEKINYAKGIMTRRLFEGGFREIYSEDEGSDMDEPSFTAEQQSREKKSSAKPSPFTSKRKFNSIGDLLRHRSKKHRLRTKIYLNNFFAKVNEKIKKQHRKNARIQNALSQPYFPACLKLLYYLSVIYLLASFALITVIDLMQMETYSTLKTFSVIEYDNGVRSDNILEVYSNLRDISTLNKGINLFLNSPSKVDIEEYKAESFNYILESLDTIIEKTNEIKQFSLKIKEKKQAYLDLMNTKNITVFLGKDKYENYSFGHVLGQLTSKIMRIKSQVESTQNSAQGESKFAMINDKNPDVEFILVNAINNIHGTIKLLKKFTKSKRDKIFFETHQMNYRIYLASTLSINFVFLAILLGVHCFFEKQQGQVIQLFYGFEYKYTKSLQRNSEKFLSYIQNFGIRTGEDKHDLSIYKELSNDSAGVMSMSASINGSREGSVGKYRRREVEEEMWNQGGSSRSSRGSAIVWFECLKCFYLFFISAMLVMSLFVIIDDHKQIEADVHIVDSVSSMTNSLVDNNFLRCGLKMRMIDYNGNHTLKARKSDEVIKEYNEIIVTNYEKMYKDLLDYSSLDEGYKKVFQAIFIKNACLVYKDVINQKDQGITSSCESMYNGVLKYGLFTSLANHLDELQELTKTLEYYLQHPDFDWIGKDKCEEHNLTQENTSDFSNNLICILTSKKAYKLKVMQRKFLRPFMYKVSSFAEDTAIKKMEISMKERRDYLYYFGFFHLFGVLVVHIMVKLKKSEATRLNYMFKFHDYSQITKNKKLHSYVEYLLERAEGRIYKSTIMT